MSGSRCRIQRDRSRSRDRPKARHVDLDDVESLVNRFHKDCQETLEAPSFSMQADAQMKYQGFSHNSSFHMSWKGQVQTARALLTQGEGLAEMLHDLSEVVYGNMERIHKYVAEQTEVSEERDARPQGALTWEDWVALMPGLAPQTMPSQAQQMMPSPLLRGTSQASKDIVTTPDHSHRHDGVPKSECRPKLMLPDEAQLDAALHNYQNLVKGMDGRSNLSLVFSPGLKAAHELHQKVQEMGVKLVKTSVAGDVPGGTLPPFASVLGDHIQPGLCVTWRLSPSEYKTTLQLQPKKNSITIMYVKGRKAAIDPCIEQLLAFFGPVMEIGSSSPSKARGANSPSNVVSNGVLNVRAMLQAAARGSDA